MWPWPDPWQASAVAMDVLLATHAPASMLELRRRRRYQALVTAAAAAPRWREQFERHGSALADQPPLDKAGLMARFEDGLTRRDLHLPALRAFLADPAQVGRPYDGTLAVWESSGSSGEPGVYLQDAAALVVYDALEALRRPGAGWQRWLDPWQAGERIAFVGATGGHFASTVSVERLRDLVPGGSQRLRGFSFLMPRHELVAALNEWQPRIVATYPTAALLLADEAAAGRLRLSLREVWTGGEALTASMRLRIGQSLGCTARASYGASEFLALAAECAHGSLHLNSDWAILESVDEQGRAVPDGETGATCLLTNLANHLQPLIRYDLGDRIRLAPQRCACGSALPVLTVQGRVDETLRLDAPGGGSVALLPLALTTVLEDEAGVFDFVLEQTGPRTLRLTLADHHPAAALDRAHGVLATYLQAQGLGHPRLELRRAPAEAPARSGKRARIRGPHGGGAHGGGPHGARLHAAPR